MNWYDKADISNRLFSSEESKEQDSNWYREAKLIDKTKNDPTQTIYTACSYCNRFATSPDGSPNSNKVWKLLDEMDPEEKEQTLNAMNIMQNQDNREEFKKSAIGISHGMCPECFEKEMAKHRDLETV